MYSLLNLNLLSACEDVWNGYDEIDFSVGDVSQMLNSTKLILSREGELCPTNLNSPVICVSKNSSSFCDGHRDCRNGVDEHDCDRKYQQPFTSPPVVPRQLYLLSGFMPSNSSLYNKANQGIYDSDRNKLLDSF